MLFCQRVFIGLIFLGCLAGCALSPQELKPNPIVGNSLSNVGHGQAVSVNVVDQRPSAIIGTRGGLYSSTSSITVQSNDIVPKLQKQAEEALSKMGYRPQSGSSTTLTIVIDSIVYTPSDSNFANDASVKAVLKAQLKTPSKTYNGKYSSTTSQGFTTAPSLEQNNAFVSDVLGNVLTNVFKDSNLSGSM
ncbi:hypothetical protein DKL61_11685 [Gammaproteobacteria bacterium ESL0073]|nr:hypothetical protein DKL61_11685 [Gammaproteobacteria bacterium ESL0073]